MLKITLAGLVLQGVMSLEKAEQINSKLSNRVIPETIKEIVDAINEFE